MNSRREKQFLKKKKKTEKAQSCGRSDIEVQLTSCSMLTGEPGGIGEAPEADRAFFATRGERGAFGRKSEAEYV